MTGLLHPISDAMVGDWLRRRREEAGVSIHEIATEYNRTIEYWEMVEEGMETITIQKFARHLLFLGKDQINFFGLTLSIRTECQYESTQELGEQLQTWRMLQGYSLRALAVRASKPFLYLQRLEHGKGGIQIRDIIKLDEVLQKNGELFNLFFQFYMKKVYDAKYKPVLISIRDHTILIPPTMREMTTHPAFWQRKIAPVLWCMAVMGRSTRPDIALLLELDFVSLAKAFGRLKGLKYIEEFKSMVLTSFVMVRLTPLGRMLCAQFGWTIIDSDLDLIIQRHQGQYLLRHTAALLWFANLFRELGLQVDVVPILADFNTPSPPDLRVTNGIDEIYFEVEIKARSTPEKWRWQLELQGFAAFLILTSVQRELLESKIRGLGIENILAYDLRDKPLENPFDEIKNLGRLENKNPPDLGMILIEP